ncbi:cyclin-K-like protein [Sarcoptes scabiei]|uniref:Cyclin-K-like protein n=1 Tax=Sarcoptes scabiei TaxID=52283 RepID=A0A132ACR1_SARSC|nr:cyclin-K-like protein [Sarcoptes scabiei]
MTQMDSKSLTNSQTNNCGNQNNNPNGQQSSQHLTQYNWYFDKSELKRTPSILDNISYETERNYRNEGARFILNVGSQMKLRYDTLATGVVYFHRFYMRHSFRLFPHYVTAACCLFLAGKAEETPKKCKDIIKIAKTFLNDQLFSTFGDDPREEVLTLERIVLQTIRFDLQVEHPYKYLIIYAKCFKGNRDHIQEVLQVAWTFTNDSLCTTICLQWEPEIVAIAMIFLASKIRFYEITDWEGRLPHQKHWWDIYAKNLSVEILEDVCHQVLDLYSKPSEESQNRSPLPLTSPQQQQTPSSSSIMTNSPPIIETAPTTPSKSFTIQTGKTNQQLATNLNQSFQPALGMMPATIPSLSSTNVPGAPAVVINPHSGVPIPPPPPTAAAIPPPPPTIHCPPTLPPQSQQTWDPNMASFYQNYNFSVVGKVSFFAFTIY